LAESGRAVLAGLPALDATSVTEAIERGDAAIVAVGQGVTALTAVRDEQRALVADDRLSQATRTGLVATDAALAAAAGLPDAWAGVSARAGLMTALLSSLAEHDRLVLAATDAGRDARWQSALDLLASAEAQLEVARGLSGSLAGDGHVATLDELLDRYSDFDAALVALYAEIDRTGTDQGPEIDALRGDVDRTRAALPQTTGALSVAVSEAAGDRIALAVVDIEQARGVLAAARRALGDE
jgi:hypothetical protein